MSHPHVILDWSGTVVNDLPAVLAGANAVLAAAGHEPMGTDTFRREFELPFMRFYNRWAPDMSRDQVDALYFARFREVEHTIAVLPHARDFLAFCRDTGRQTAVLTSVDPASFAEQLERFGIAAWFDATECGVEDKRDGVRRLLARTGWDPGTCLMVGDMPHDIDAGRSVAMETCAVLSGYGTEDVMRSAGPDLVLNHLCELRAHLAAADAAAGTPWLTVGALVRRPDGRRLFVRTRKWNGLWGVPGGKVRCGESMEAALVREFLEETGLHIHGIQRVLIQEAIRHPEFHKPVHMLLVNFVACTDEANVALNDEADEFRWLHLEEAQALPLNQPTRALLEEVQRGR